MATSLGEGNSEFKPIIDLERNDCHQAIPAEDMLQSDTPSPNQTDQEKKKPLLYLN